MVTAMRIGVISDTHDDLKKTRNALEAFRAANVSQIIHCGDWCAPFTAALFSDPTAPAPAPVVAVLGNNDGDLLLLHKKLSAGGHTLAGQYAFLKLDGKHIAVAHGQHPEIIDALAHCGQYDVVFHGHTHTRRNERIGDTLVANPGWEHIIIYDTVTDHIEFQKIKE